MPAIALQTSSVPESLEPASSADRFPVEVRQHIASFLKIADAQNLALVSKDWHVPGESALWRYLDLTLTDFGVRRQRKVKKCLEGRAVPDELDYDPVSRLCPSFDTVSCFIKARRVLSGLMAKPKRVMYVKSLKLVICPSTIHLAKAILSLISGTLTEFILYEFSGHYTRLTDNDYPTFVRHIFHSDMIFPRLTSFTLHTSHRDPGEILIRVPVALPALRHLTLNAIQDYQHVTPIPVFARDCAPRALQKLTFIGSINNFLDMMEIFDQCHILSIEAYIHDGVYDGAYLESIESLKGFVHLRSLVFSGSDWCEDTEIAQALNSTTHFQNLTFCALYAAWDRDSFPCLPAVRTYAFDYAGPPDSIGDLYSHLCPDKTYGQATDWLAKGITDNPQLLQIIARDHKRTQLISVRVYSRPSAQHAFHHYRIYDLGNIVPKETRGVDFAELVQKIPHMTIVISSRPCIDVTYYRGIVVPRRLFVDIYQSFNQRTDWLAPGRDLEMPRQAWDLLEMEAEKESGTDARE